LAPKPALDRTWRNAASSWQASAQTTDWLDTPGIEAPRGVPTKERGRSFLK
jgi:hypothetical protein